MLQVVEIKEIEHLEAMRLCWASLLYKTPGASFFHTLDWLKVYWLRFRDSQQLRVLLVRRAGTVIGMLPLMLQKSATATGSVDVLTYPTLHPSHFYGPIGPNPSATLMASLRHLAGQPRDWDVLSLVGIGERDHGRTANAMQLAGLYTREDVHTTVSNVCFGASWREYLSELKIDVAKESKDLDREGKIIGNLKFERVRPLGILRGDDPPLESLVEECVGLNGHFSSEDKVSAWLLRHVALVASRLGMLDLNLLRCDNRLIAFSLNVHVDGAVQQLCSGATTTPLNCRPASMLMVRMLRDSFLRKDRGIDLAASNDDAASRWATRQLPSVSYQHRTLMPLRERLTRFGQWLASPLTRA